MDVGSVFSATDSNVLRVAALRGVGVAVISEYLVRDALQLGDLIRLLPGFHVPDLSLKVLVPDNRYTSPTVRAIIDALVAASQPVAPWDRI